MSGARPNIFAVIWRLAPLRFRARQHVKLGRPHCGGERPHPERDRHEFLKASAPWVENLITPAPTIGRAYWPLVGRISRAARTWRYLSWARRATTTPQQSHLSDNEDRSPGGLCTAKGIQGDRHHREHLLRLPLAHLSLLRENIGASMSSTCSPASTAIRSVSPFGSESPPAIIDRAAFDAKEKLIRFVP